MTTDPTFSDPATLPEPAEGRSPLLQLEDLRVRFDTRGGGITVLEGVSLELFAGETVAVLGESGSGKSVTARAIMGLLPKPAGRVIGGQIRYDGVDLVGRTGDQVRRLRGPEMAMVFQDPLSSLNPVFRIGHQIGEALRRRQGASRREARSAAIDLMQRVGIPDPQRRVDDFPHQFSGGMRQRVMIAIALALKPRLLIADEPTTALDVTVQAQIMDLLAGLKDEYGMSMMLITHDLGVVADVADRVLLMYAGRVVEAGQIRDVYDTPAHPYAQGLMNSIPQLGDDQHRLSPITGAPPNLAALPSGCPFRPRCPYATDVCAELRPELRHPTGWNHDHLTACHRCEEVLTP